MEEMSTDYTLNHSLAQVTDIGAVAEAIDSFIARLVAPALALAEDTDYVSLQVFHPELESPIFVSYTTKSNFTAQSFMNKLFRFAQSGVTRFLLNGRLTVRVSILRMCVGRARSARVAFEIDSFFGRKNDVVQIINDSNSCAYLAITLGVLYADHLANGSFFTRYTWNQLRLPNSPRLRREMERLCLTLGIDHSIPFDLSLAPAVQQRLPQHQLVIIRRPTPQAVFGAADAPLFKGPERQKRVIIEFVPDQNHYNFVKKMTGYHSVECFCYSCWRPTRPNHQCPGCCPNCRSPAVCEGQEGIKCSECNVTFNSQECFANHQSKQLCRKRSYCVTCETTFNPKEKHECDSSKCLHCDEVYKEPPHFCFMKPLELNGIQKKDKETKIFVFFDIESRLDDVADGTCFHHAILVVAHTYCDACFDPETEKTSSCTICGSLEQVFYGEDCVTRFMDHLMTTVQKDAQRKKIKRVYVVSHNFRGYDGRFVLQELLKRRYIGVETVFTGTKILKIDVGLMRFLDSLSFLPMKLEQLPKSFPSPVFASSLRKGYFPHAFSKLAHMDYVGAWPALHFYEPQQLKQEARVALANWHKEQEGKVFHFRSELISYCRNDCVILSRCFLEFRRLFTSVTGIDVTTRAFTIAAASLETFRTLHLGKEMIGITPINGYLGQRNSSSIATAWLDVLQESKGIVIAREKRIGPYFADGYHEASNTIFEFFGCRWHGCPTCSHETVVPGKTREQLFEETQRKLDYYARRGFSVIHVWEHEVAWSPQLSNRYHTLQGVRVSCTQTIRESLCGGRTEAFRLMYDCVEGERLRYLDFTSLYPTVLKYEKFPLKHPVLVTDGLDVATFAEKNFFGFVYCRVLPPRDLFIPVLPFKTEDRLLFGLCCTCMTLKQSDPCSHTDAERAIDGCFTSVELTAALECGYQLLDVRAVLHYPSTTDNLFRPYVDLFLRLKQEASGRPPDVNSEEELDAYIADFARHEGIDLDKSRIERNEGLRLIAKLFLNNLWGKLAQRSNMPKTTLISDYQTLAALVTDPEIEVLGSSIMDNQNVLVTHKQRSDAECNPGNTSPAIACFVTAHARLRLFRLIQKIEAVREHRICYCDTDSVIFVERVGQDPPVPLGNYLGDLTDEIPPGYACKRAVFAGAKSYALELVPEEEGASVKTVVKVKGLSLSAEASNTINFDSMSHMVQEFARQGHTEATEVPQTVFRVRSRYDQQMTTQRIAKLFRVTNDKRYTLGTVTYPYGFARE